MNSAAQMSAVVLASAILLAAPVTESAAQDNECDTVCIEVKVYRHLKLMGEFGQDKAIQASLRELTELGAPVARVAHDIFSELTRTLPADLRKSAQQNIMRWRVVHLMGDLGQPESILPLYDIARQSLPNPQADENVFAQEYRIRLRPIDFSG